VLAGAHSQDRYGRPQGGRRGCDLLQARDGRFPDGPGRIRFRQITSVSGWLRSQPAKVSASRSRSRSTSLPVCALTSMVP
jgi:hypothetical protein